MPPGYSPPPFSYPYTQPSGHAAAPPVSPGYPYSPAPPFELTAQTPSEQLRARGFGRGMPRPGMTNPLYADMSLREHASRAGVTIGGDESGGQPQAGGRPYSGGLVKERKDLSSKLLEQLTTKLEHGTVQRWAAWAMPQLTAKVPEMRVWLAAPLMQRCVELAVVEGKGCIYFGFSRNAGCQLVCRSAYATADALEAHLRGASPLAAAVGTLSEDGEIATLDAARLDAPAATLEAMRADTLEYHGCKVQPFSIDPREGGFQRFELTGYNMGLLDLNK